MPKLRVHCFGVSLDGYGAGPNQSREDPLGIGGESLHDWFIPNANLSASVRPGRRDNRC